MVEKLARKYVWSCDVITGGNPSTEVFSFEKWFRRLVGTQVAYLQKLRKLFLDANLCREDDDPLPPIPGNPEPQYGQATAQNTATLNAEIASILALHKDINDAYLAEMPQEPPIALSPLLASRFSAPDGWTVVRNQDWSQVQEEDDQALDDEDVIARLRRGATPRDAEELSPMIRSSPSSSHLHPPSYM